MKIGKQQAAKEQKLRRKNLTKYVPNAAAAVFKVLQTMSETPAVRPVSTLQTVSETPSQCAESAVLRSGRPCLRRPRCAGFVRSPTCGSSRRTPILQGCQPAGHLLAPCAAAACWAARWRTPHDVLTRSGSAR